MADGAIAMFDLSREHLRGLRIEAQVIAERMAGGALYTPDDDGLVERIYHSLRAQAYQRDLEPFVRTAARLTSMCMPDMRIINGVVERTETPHEAKVREQLDVAAAALRRHYELDPPTC